jgi:hypothetical protein
LVVCIVKSLEALHHSGRSLAVIHERVSHR